MHGGIRPATALTFILRIARPAHLSGVRRSPELGLEHTGSIPLGLPAVSPSRIAIACASAAALLLAPAALAAQDEQAAPAAPPTPLTVFSSSRVIVQWQPAADHADKVGARDEAEVDFKSDLGNRSFQLVEVQPGQTARDAIGELRGDPAVVVAERDAAVAPNSIPNDPKFGQLWGLQNTGVGISGFSGALAAADVNAPAAWDQTVGSPTTVVADIDSGYRFEHPDLANVAWTNPAETANGLDDDGNSIVDDIHGADFVGNNGEAPSIDGNPTDEDLLSGGHGVHTAGTMGAQGNNGAGITGVSQNVRIMPLRVCSRFPSLEESRCPTSSQIAAINYAAAKGARGVNMSLGGTSSSQAVVNAIAAAKETLFVISAGNDAEDNDSVHHYPCDYTPQTQASPPVPGAIDNIVCVAATNQADGLASFSDWGATSVDLGAPGTETLSTYPYATPLEDTFTVDDFASKWPATGANGGFQRTSESPLTSFGMTDAIGPPAANSVHETTSAPVSVAANGGCRLNQTRRVVLGSGGHYRYSVLLNGVEQVGAISEPASTSAPGLDRRFLELPATFNAGGNVQVRFRFTTGSLAAPGDGVWLDDVSIVCAEAVGQASSYGFLQGTSMAAPHVTGAAGLLFSLKPLATVTEVKDALLAGVDAVPSLSGKTTSGGRLDIAKAMDSLEGNAVDHVAPAAPSLFTVPDSGANDNHPKIKGSAEAGATVTVFKSLSCAGTPIATGTAAELANPGIEVSVPDNSITFLSASATDAARNKSSCSTAISYLEDTPPEGEVVVEELPPGSVEEARRAIEEGNPPARSLSPSIPVCKVPKVVGMTLGQATSALAKAGCRVRTVIKPKPRKGHKTGALVVKASTPPAGGSAGEGKVTLILGPKPKPKKHRHH
jgi:subtilisin family serine protease